VAALLDAFEELAGDTELVLAGAAAIQTSGRDRPGVRGEPEVPPARLAELLAGAVALVHPSLHEGFGLTLLEAMRAGTPVVAVHNPGVEEVCGDAALLVPPAELGAAMARVAADPALRERLAAAGRERAEVFSWARSAALHVQAYSRALASAR
jgi:glycosyltransferase involved in cell wall biosynthesis